MSDAKINKLIKSTKLLTECISENCRELHNASIKLNNEGLKPLIQELSEKRSKGYDAKSLEPTLKKMRKKIEVLAKNKVSKDLAECSAKKCGNKNMINIKNAMEIYKQKCDKQKDAKMCEMYSFSKEFSDKINKKGFMDGKDVLEFTRNERMSL